MADTLMLPSEVAELLRVSTRQVSERYAMRPDFPAPVRLSSGSKSRMRWYRSQIEQWVADQQQRAA